MEKIINIDFHAHILPEMDHGCDSVNTALKQLYMAQQVGVDVVVATSHFYPQAESVESFIARREEAFQKLHTAMETSTEVLPMVLKGAEVLVCRDMEDMEGLKNLCVEGTNTLLLEMPFAVSWEDELYKTVKKICNENISVVLAHAERYNPKLIEPLYGWIKGVQINVASVGLSKRSARVRKYHKDDIIVALGTDIHGTGNYYRKYKKACKTLGFYTEAIQQRMMELIDVQEYRD